MTNKEQQLKAEIEYLYTALRRIAAISPFDKVYEIASSACDAYMANRKAENLETKPSQS